MPRTLSQECVLSTDQVVLGACMDGAGGVLWEGVLHTEGQRDRVVTIKRVLCGGAAAVARRVAALLSRRINAPRVVGLLDVGPFESYVVLECDQLKATMLQQTLGRPGPTDVLRLPRAAALQQLQHLDLSSCFDITDAGLASVAFLRQLRHLNLHKCKKVTDAGLTDVAKLQQLRYLSLNKCKGITDAGLAIITKLKQLQRLSLESCNKITNAGLVCVATLEQLRYLSLTDCNLISDAGILSIASLQQLQYLYLDYCDNITDAGLVSVATLHQLLFLSLYHCNLITDAGILSGALPSSRTFRTCTSDCAP